MNANTRLADQTDDPNLFKALRKRPKIAWPTIALFFASFALFGLSTFAYVAGVLSLFWAIVLNSIAAYMSFTPAHDASHGAVSTNSKLNNWVGRIATVLQSPVPFFSTFRYIHMQHHRFTNDETKDPDLYVGTGPRWLLPFKWATLDLNYFYYYLQPSVFMKRPKGERRELYLAAVFGAAVFTAVTLAGWLDYYLLLFLIPTRINAVLLALTFDFLPHYPHQAHAKDQPFQCTSNRVGMEWLLTPVLLSQNYHLVHHLYPTVPFYRYLKVWNAKKHYHESQNPAIVDTFSLGPRIENEDGEFRGHNTF
ncbi:MAG: fatty acid desaturase [Pseudomonadales bacterium]|nr:fatty acid desaturase [Pseudomonadales bacterium]